MAISSETRQLIVELYQTNISIVAISKKVKVSEPTISKILKQAGIQIRKDNYQKLNINKAEINRLYSEGKSSYEIAAIYKCSDETIRLLLDEIRDISSRNKRDPQSKMKISNASLRNWQDPKYVEKVKLSTNTEEYKHKLSLASKVNYQSSLGAWIKTIEAKLAISEAVKRKWQDESYRNKQSLWFQQRAEIITAASKEALSDPNKRAKWLDKIRTNSVDRRIKGGWISSAQKQLYYILAISGIDYHEEGQDTKIGPFYVVDCVIPPQQNMKRPLIIEVQGEYWHSLPHVMLKDRQKETYIRKYTNYDLLSLDELHLASFNEIGDKLSSYGLRLRKDECTVHDLRIESISEAEAAMFYSVFHYTGSIRKGAIVYGAFLNDELVAAISYCYPLRSQTTSRLNYKFGEVVEISRLSRRTNLICKNLMSFLIKKTKTLLPSDVKCIVSFSDMTYGHKGGVYKAAGFINDGIVPPDYHYISLNGKYHKKTIWDRAKRMKMTETEYAKKHNLAIVPHKEKTRWIIHLR